MPGGRPRTVFYNLDYFESIDSADKAYWLGFIFGDGTISKDCLKIHLAIKDIYQIQKFAKDVEYNKEIKKPIIQLYSRKLVIDLKNKGVKENKTYAGGTPHNVPQQFLIDCARGLFDADGSISYHPNSRTKLQAKLTTNKELLEWFKRVTGLGNTIIPIKGKFHHEMRIRAIPENFNILYGGSQRYLDRKYELVKPHILI